MPDVSLPPVGELVQITTEHGSFLARRMSEGDKWMTRWFGPPVWLPDVQSWCRVLVVPDTEEMAAMVEDSAWETIRGAAIR